MAQLPSFHDSYNAEEWESLTDNDELIIDMACFGIVCLAGQPRHLAAMLKLKDTDVPDGAGRRVFLEWFCRSLNLSLHYITRLGGEADRRGITRERNEIPRNIGSMTVSALPNFTPGDMRIDGIFDISREDMAQRYSVFTNWHNNSGAVDALIFVAIALNAGVSRVDQADVLERGLSTPARILRLLVRLPWGTLKQVQRDRLRTCLVDCLDEFRQQVFHEGDPLQFRQPEWKYDPVRGSLSFRLVASILLDRLPQLSWTTVGLSLDCFGQHFHYSTIPAKRWQSITIPKTANTIEEGVNHVFDSHQGVGKPYCSKPRCKGDHTIVKQVLDRPPPVLMIFPEEPFGRDNPLAERMADPFTLKYYSWADGEQRATYVQLGLVLERRGGEGLVLWSRPTGEVLYNGKRGPGVIKLDDKSAEELTRPFNIVVMYYLLTTKSTTSTGLASENV